MFLGDDLDTPADTSLAPSPVPQSTHLNGEDSDNMQVDSDDDARDADADGDADIDADGDYVEEPDQVPVSYNPNASSSRLIGRQVGGSGQVQASEINVLFYTFRFCKMMTMCVPSPPAAFLLTPLNTSRKGFR